MSAHAGGMCMSQCKHWRILLFSFSVPRKEKENTGKSPLSRRAAMIRFAQIVWEGITNPLPHPPHAGFRLFASQERDWNQTVRTVSKRQFLRQLFLFFPVETVRKPCYNESNHTIQEARNDRLFAQ